MIYENITSLFKGCYEGVNDLYQFEHISDLEGFSYVYRGFTEGPEDELNSAILNYY